MEFETFRFVMVQYFQYFYMMSYDYDVARFSIPML